MGKEEQQVTQGHQAEGQRQDKLGDPRRQVDEGYAAGDVFRVHEASRLPGDNRRHEGGEQIDHHTHAGTCSCREKARQHVDVDLLLVATGRHRTQQADPQYQQTQQLIAAGDTGAEQIAQHYLAGGEHDHQRQHTDEQSVFHQVDEVQCAPDAVGDGHGHSFSVDLTSGYRPWRFSCGIHPGWSAVS